MKQHRKQVQELKKYTCFKKYLYVLMWLFLWLVIRIFLGLVSSFSNYVPASQTFSFSAFWYKRLFFLILGKIVASV